MDLRSAHQKPLGLAEMIFELAYAMKWTDEYILDLPVQRFWGHVENLSNHRKREASAMASSGAGPMAGFAQEQAQRAEALT